MLANSALDLSRSFQQRLNMAEGSADLQAKLTAERDKAALRHNHNHRVLSACNQFLFQLRLAPGFCLESVPPLDFKIRTSLPNAVEATRARIAEVQREIAVVRAAPLKQASQQDAVNRYLASQALRVAPRVGFDAKGNARVLWAEDLLHSKDDLLGVLYWIAPSSVSKAFAEMLSPGPELEGALSPEEREQAIKRLSSTQLQMEMQEEFLIEQAALGGHEITRRPDVDPRAVLQIQIVAQEQGAVASAA
jgi:hypothetical protein